MTSTSCAYVGNCRGFDDSMSAFALLGR